MSILVGICLASIEKLILLSTYLEIPCNPILYLDGFIKTAVTNDYVKTSVLFLSLIMNHHL